MGAETGIAWCDHTFNPWWGCTRVSPGCENCYAEAFSKRVGHKVWGPRAEHRRFGDKHWSEPLAWNRKAELAGVRRRVFCASMADVFEGREEDEADRVRLFRLVVETPHLDWLLLTKRPENILDLVPYRWVCHGGRWQPNVWAGCTAEDQRRAEERVPHLLRVPAAARFLSCEPLLGPVDLTAVGPDRIDALRGTMPGCSLADHGRVDWVIVGGESGPGARKFNLAWARSLVAQCRAAGVACFVKQLGANPLPDVSDMATMEPTPRAAADAAALLAFRDPKGGNPDEWPEDLRVREWPAVRP